MRRTVSRGCPSHTDGGDSWLGTHCIKSQKVEETRAGGGDGQTAWALEPENPEPESEL